jgi:hypothetical protein
MTHPLDHYGFGGGRRNGRGKGAVSNKLGMPAKHSLLAFFKSSFFMSSWWRIELTKKLLKNKSLQTWPICLYLQFFTYGF